MKTTFTFFLSLIFCACSMVAQHVIHVPGDRGSIQDAIDAAVIGDTVLVDQGTYYENINFKGKSITVMSHFAISMDSTDLFNTIIDGSQPTNPDSASVVCFNNFEDTTSVISGFTITGGKGIKTTIVRGGGGIMCWQAGPLIEHCRIINNECTDTGAWVAGGGIHIFSCHVSTPIIRDNDISGNKIYKTMTGNGVAYGGGISVENAGGPAHYILRNTISNNLCANEVNNKWVIGGGIYIDHVKAIILENTIENNQVTSTDNSYIAWGAGVYCWEILEKSTISGNAFCNNIITANYRNGGGLSVNKNTGEVLIDQNIFEGNEARRGAGLAIDYNQDIYVTNNIFKGNIAQSSGGGIWIRADDKMGKGHPKKSAGARITTISDNGERSAGVPVIANNTFVENTTFGITNRGRSIHLEVVDSPLIAFNNIFFNDENGADAEIYLSQSGTEAYFYNNILDTANQIYGYGNWVAIDNIAGSPCLVDDSCHLADSSCCINSGTNKVHVNGVDYFPPDHDIDGDGRPLNEFFEIGADEKLWEGIIEPYHLNSINTYVYPNPASGWVNFQYTTSSTLYVKLAIYNNQGKLIETLSDKIQGPGTHEISWDVNGLKAGMYLYKFMIEGKVSSGKIIVQ